MNFGALGNWFKHYVDGHNFQITVRNHYFPEMWYIIEAFFSVSQDKTVLDLGCGNGRISEALGKSGWNVTCTDPVLDCLLRTQGRFRKADLEARFEQCQPEKLPFGDQTFQHVVCLNLLEVADSRTHTLREIHRVLKPGGQAVICTMANFGLWGRTSILQQLRVDTKSSDARFYRKGEFVKVLQREKFRIERLKGCARYLPASGKSKINVPFTGAYVALVNKPMKSIDEHTGETRVIRK